MVTTSDKSEFIGLKEAMIVTDITACANNSGISFVQVYYGVVSADGVVGDKVAGSVHGLADA